MANKVEIANLALGWLGANLITSLDDPQREAQLVKANYDSIRDAVLEDGAWTFAIKRYEPPVLQETPAYGYSHQFQLPKDVIRVLECRNDKQTHRQQNSLFWDKEGDRILCDSDAIQVRAVARITDENLFSSAFVQAFAARLAADLCIPITENNEVEQRMWARYEEKLQKAAMLDGSQGRNTRYRSGWLNNSRGYSWTPGSPYFGPYV